MRLLVALVLVARFAGLATAAPPARIGTLEERARAPVLWTGIAVTPDERIFVSFPRVLQGSVDVAVAELVFHQGMATIRPYPPAQLDEQGRLLAWYVWDRDQADALGAVYNRTHLVSVQSVVTDEAGSLWILDTGLDSPIASFARPGGPKLVRVDLERDAVADVIPLDEVIVSGFQPTFLNDVRVDARRGVAVLTDSNRGALVVVDLAEGSAWRVLDGHPSTQPEPTSVVVEDVVRDASGALDVRSILFPFVVASDGIALDRRSGTVYYQALVGRTLYRVAITDLVRARDPAAPAPRVERVGGPEAGFGPADGLAFGPDGRLYLTSLEDHALKRFDPRTGRLEVVSDDPRLAWPDGLAFDARGRLYVTVSQLHRFLFARERLAPEGFALFRIPVAPGRGRGQALGRR